MKNVINKILVFGLLAILFSCSSSKVSFAEIQSKVYANDFNFVAKNFETRKSYVAPAGTGRILSSNINVSTDEKIGVQVNHDQLVINLPLDSKESELNMTTLDVISKDFTVARKDLDNGNILVNFFLNDQKDINIIKMEIDQKGKIDCSIEGPKQKALFYVGTLEMN